MKRSLRQLTNKEIRDALPMVWTVFNKYEAANYPPSGKQAFWNAIKDENFILPNIAVKPLALAMGI